MQNTTKSLLQELIDMDHSEARDKQHIIEARASNVVSSAINLLKLITEVYGPEQAVILERKLLNAIKARDMSRFTNSIRKTRE